MAVGRISGRDEVLAGLNRTLIFLIIGLGLIGAAAQYSVAGESFSPWAWKHLVRLAVGVMLMIGIATISPRTFYAAAYPFYGICLVGLIGVELFGELNMGAQRWLNLGFIRVQPSELMRIGLILALARYYQSLNEERVSKPVFLIVPLLLIAVPAYLIYRQPDLGTALLLAMIGFTMLFLTGVSVRYFLAAFIGLAVGFPFVWQALQPYQQDRILVFFDPERDPLGAGYHIIQSIIGIGSGGFTGKGFGEGTQNRLNFLPEKHTDFIFTMFAEELGFMGSLLILSLFSAILFVVFMMARDMKSQFGRLSVLGLGASLFIYMFVNLAMVMGLAPVVGVPLPFVSYGGTSLLTFAVTFGIILALDRQSSVDVGR